MATFRARPPSLLGANRPRPAEVDAKRIHVPVARATVDCAIYVDGERLPGKYTHAAALERVRELEAEGQQAFVWIGLHEPDEFQMQSVAEVFGLHPLAVEDAVHAHQRPKVERYDDTCSWSSRPSSTFRTSRSHWPARSWRPARSWCSSAAISW